MFIHRQIHTSTSHYLEQDGILFFIYLSYNATDFWDFPFVILKFKLIFFFLNQMDFGFSNMISPSTIKNVLYRLRGPLYAGICEG